VGVESPAPLPPPLAAVLDSGAIALCDSWKLRCGQPLGPAVPGVPTGRLVVLDMGWGWPSCSSLMPESPGPLVVRFTVESPQGFRYPESRLSMDTRLALLALDEACLNNEFELEL
jgi:hypothetical protein